MIFLLLLVVSAVVERAWTIGNNSEYIMIVDDERRGIKMEFYECLFYERFNATFACCNTVQKVRSTAKIESTAWWRSVL